MVRDTVLETPGLEPGAFRLPSDCSTIPMSYQIDRVSRYWIGLVQRGAGLPE